jgi:hypothetical protein
MPEMGDLTIDNSRRLASKRSAFAGYFKEGSAMTRRAILFCCFLCASIETSAAQEPNRRVNLDVVSNAPLPSIVVSRVSFAQGDSQCPEDRGQLRISGGTLALIRATPTDPRPTSDWRMTAQPIDDETQLYRLETSACQMDIAIRQQVRREGSWKPLLVPKQQRPSVPEEERRELQRQFIENLRTPKEPNPSIREMVDRQIAANKERLAWGNSGFAPFMRMPFAFEDRPEVCFEALADFHVDRSEVQFSFLTPLPGDLNRFVIENANPDANRGRLYFMRGDCRFELTISQSVLRDGEWISVPLAMTAPPKQ